VRHRILEQAGIGAFVLLACIALARVVASLLQQPASSRVLMVLLAMLLGYVIADLLSGIVHWAFDTWWSETTPIIGQAFVKPFRDHHVDPSSITQHDWVETNGNNCLGALPVLVVAFVVPTSSTRGLFTCTLMLSLALGVLATNQFHKWAHEEDPGRVVRTLQRWHLILPAAHHRVHHASPHDTHYCITTGWFNAVLAASGAFRTMERAVRWSRRSFNA
jgi:plasmanylethanolamine desaturase